MTTARGIVKFRFPNSMPLADRFWNRVVKSDGCWSWLGSSDPHGRGQIKYHGRHYLAPRLSWIIANGREVPPGMNVLHSCDNPNCVRSSHLFIGTQKDNVADADAKGRRPSFRDVNRKLDDAEVVSLRTLFIKQPFNISAKAREIGVHSSVLHRAVHGQTFKHVSDRP